MEIAKLVGLNSRTPELIEVTKNYVGH